MRICVIKVKVITFVKSWSGELYKNFRICFSTNQQVMMPLGRRAEYVRSD